MLAVVTPGMTGATAKIILFSAIGVGLVVLGVVIGKSDIKFQSAIARVDGFTLLAEIPRIQKRAEFVAQDEVKPAVRTAAQASAITTVIAKKVADPLPAVTTTSSTSSVIFGQMVKHELVNPAEDCHFDTKQFPQYQPLAISEVAWMGSPEDSGNEWIELRNTTTTTIDVEGYWVIDKAEQIKVHLSSKKIEPDGFYLLERGDDAVPSTTADVIYTGALSNSNEGLRLFDPWCNLLDQALADPSWPSGNSTSKKTMERGGNWIWYTFNGTTTADNILGTPGKPNTAPNSPVAQYLPLATSDTSSAAKTVTSSPEPEPPVEEPTPPVDTTPASLKLVISSLQTTGGSGKTTEDFVEFYNPGPGDFNLKGYRLVKRTKTGTSDTSIKSWTDDAIIPQGGSYRWANSSYPGSADMRTSGSIADDNAVALRRGSEDTGEVIDAVGWGAAANSLVEGSVFAVNPKAAQVLVRKGNQDTDNNAADFEIQ